MNENSLMTAVFFDKDGTLIEDVPYNVNPDLMRLQLGAAETVRNLKLAGCKIFVITNQSGAARGYFAEKDLTAVWQKLNELCGAEFDGFYYCPHHPEGAVERYKMICECRKPGAEMILRAAREHHLDLTKSWFVGDSLSDIEAGRRVGCQTILIGSSNQNQANFRAAEKPHFIAENLPAAAEMILAE